ncbi:MAG TPA: D-alanine--D-alanine ligase [Thermohalobaculum sp.]|nr:D-alanine--D-alanine ligase [Thermohalobaculum sp.]
MRIGFVYDARDAYLAEGFSEIDVAEFDTEETIAEVEAALMRAGCEVERIGRGTALARRLAAGESWDLVFPIAEGLSGRAREAQVPALCELFGQDYAFSDPLTMAATLDKAVAKRLVRDQGVPTADFALLRRAEDARSVDLGFPLFVKPVAEGTGKGCEAASIVADRGELEAVAARLVERFRQPAIAEAYLEGREFTVGVLGNGAGAGVIGVLEIVVRPDAEDPVYSFDNKEHCEGRVIYRLAEDPEALLAGGLALAAYRALECRDAARIDLRSDAAGVPQFLEANPIAGLHPTHSDLPMLARLAGRSYDWLMGGILDAAAGRLGLERRRRASVAA